MTTQEISYNGALIRVEKISMNAESLLIELDNNLSHREVLKSFSTDKRKLEYLTVRLALKRLLGKDTLIKYNNDGKPFLVDNSHCISISHTNGWVAVMAHPSMEVGIDIEIPTEKIKKISSRFLSPIEQEELHEDFNLSQIQLAWSAKEALYKTIGKDALDFAKQLRIFPFEVKTTGTIKAQHLLSTLEYELMYIQTDNYNLVFLTNSNK